MPDIYDSTYVVYFADKESLPKDADYTWSTCSGASTDDGRLILNMEHTDRFEDLTDKARATGEIFASGIGNTVDDVVFVYQEVTGHVPDRWPGGSRHHRVSTETSPL